MNFWKRFKQLWAAERVIDFSPIEKAVEEYFNAGHHDIIALADSMNLTPKQLYFMMSTDHLRANILPALPEKERNILTKEICARVFSRNTVYFSTTPDGDMNTKYDLYELVSRIDMVRANVANVGDTKELPTVEVERYIFPTGERVCCLRLVCEEFDRFLGKIAGLTEHQENLLMVRYGQSNSC